MTALGEPLVLEVKLGGIRLHLALVPLGQLPQRGLHLAVFVRPGWWEASRSLNSQTIASTARNLRQLLEVYGHATFFAACVDGREKWWREPPPLPPAWMPTRARIALAFGLVGDTSRRVDGGGAASDGAETASAQPIRARLQCGGDGKQATLRWNAAQGQAVRCGAQLPGTGHATATA